MATWLLAYMAMWRYRYVNVARCHVGIGLCGSVATMWLGGYSAMQSNGHTALPFCSYGYMAILLSICLYGHFEFGAIW